jgi:phospholipid/cholesterol/gamma-HCH transport system permease protein
MIAGLWQFQWQFFKQIFVPPYEIEQIRKHMDELGIKTLPIVSVTGFIIGLVITMQMHPVMVRFGAEAFLPGSVGISIVRELGPVITALIFAGRVSSGIGAELGSMRVTEQIDAMEVSAVNPFKYLVVTRMFACTFILPILTVYVIFIAFVGSFIAVVISAKYVLYHIL